MSNLKLLEEIGETAYEYDKVYHGCSQFVLRALQEHLKLGDGEAFKAASALAGGVARMGATCGALLGGIMAIGLAFGREKVEKSFLSHEYAEAMELAVRLCEEFEKEFGSVECRGVLKSLFGRSFDFKNPKELEKFKESGGFEKCPEVVKKAAQLAANIILEAKTNENP